MNDQKVQEILSRRTQIERNFDASNSFALKNYGVMAIYQAIHADFTKATPTDDEATGVRISLIQPCKGSSKLVSHFDFDLDRVKGVPFEVAGQMMGGAILQEAMHNNPPEIDVERLNKSFGQ